MGLTVTFSVGVVNTPNYLILNVIKVKYPTIIVQTLVYGPDPTSFNSFVDNLDPVNYYFDWRVSTDGVDPGILVSRFLINAATNQIVQEYRYYVADRGIGSDPAAGQSVITDDYFVGKFITAVFKEGARFLIPTDEWTLNLNVLSILQGLGSFGTGETITVIINYKEGTNTSSDNLFFKGPYTITEDTLLTTEHYNARINCAGSNPESLIITIPPAVGVPDLTYFYFNSRGGTAKQTTIRMTGGDTLFYDGFELTQNLDEIWISQGEFIWIQLVSGSYEVIQSSPTISQVGEVVIPFHLNHRGVLIGDVSLKSGLIYPRLLWYIRNCLPSINRFNAVNIASDSDYIFALTLNTKRGQFGVHPDSSITDFRMPWVEGMSFRALQNLSDWSVSRPIDTEGRQVNHPGYFQPFMVGPHTHPNVPLVFNDVDRGGGTSKFSLDDSANTQPNSGTNNIVDNIGVLIGYRY